MKITLLLFKPSGRQKEIPLRVPVAIVGRSRRCHLQLVDTRVSRRHCVLAVSGGKLRVTDLDSTTGTYVNDKRVRRATLRHGDMLCVGRFRLKVVMEAASRDAGARDGAGPRAEGAYVHSRKLALSPTDEHQEPAAAGAAAGTEEVHDQQKSVEQSAEDTVHFGSQYADERPAGEEAVEDEGRDREAEEAQEDYHQDIEEAIAAGLEEEGQEPIHTERLDPAGAHSGSVATEEPMESATPTGAQGPDKRSRRADKRPRAIVPAASTPVPAQGQGIFADEPLGPAAGPDPATAAKPFSLAILLRFKWTVLIVFVLIAGPSIATIWTLIQPKYTAKAQVRVKPTIYPLVFPTEETGALPKTYANTQVSVIRNPTLLQRVLDRPDVRKTAWYRNPSDSVLAKLKTPLPPLERLLEDLSVSPRGKTELIDVRLTALSGAEAATIVNAVLDEYIKYISETTDRTRDEMYRKLTEEYKTLKNEIEGRKKVLAKLRKELGTNVPEELVSQKRVRLDGMEARLEETQRELTIAQWQRQELADRLKKAREEASGATTQPASQPAPRPISQPKYESDLRWRGLVQSASAARQRCESERQRLRPKHPTMIRLKKEADAARALVQAREAELDKQWREGTSQLPAAVAVRSADPGNADLLKELYGLRWRVKLLTHKEQLLRKDVEKERANFGGAYDNAEMLAKENEALRHKEGLYEAVRTRLDQKEMEQRNIPARVEVFSRAIVPSRPSGDRRIIFTAMVVALGLGAGVALAFYRGMTSQAIREADDLPQPLRAPFLGQLPLVRTKRGLSPEDSPVFNEGMRMVRTALLSRIEGRPGAVVLVTSAGKGVGKSTVAASLAKSLAQAGKNVLLVDGDMRNPRLARSFGIDPEPGLVALLTQHAADSRTIVQTDTPRLSILPGGRPGGMADLELASNGAFSGCLERWRRDFEVIVLDSPPLLPVADARILSRHADGTIMVVREENCRRQEIMDALAYLGSAGGKLLGTVLISSGRRGGYGYYYHHYGYGEDKD